MGSSSEPEKQWCSFSPSKQKHHRKHEQRKLWLNKSQQWQIEWTQCHKLTRDYFRSLGITVVENILKDHWVTALHLSVITYRWHIYRAISLSLSFLISKLEKNTISHGGCGS